MVCKLNPTEEATNGVQGYRDALEEIAAQEASGVAQEVAPTSSDPSDAGSQMSSTSEQALSPTLEEHDSESLSVFENTEDSQDIPLQEISSTSSSFPPPDTPSEVFENTTETEHEEDEVDGPTVPVAATATSSTERRHLRPAMEDKEMAVTGTPGAFSTAVDVSTSLERSVTRWSHTQGPKTTHGRHHRRKPSKPTDVRHISVATHPKADTVLESYTSPTRADTEAMLGIRESELEALWNAVQANPKSLLARIITEDLLDIPAIFRMLMFYACFIMLFQVLLAIAVGGIWIPILATLPILALNAILIVRQLLEVIERFARIKKLQGSSVHA